MNRRDTLKSIIAGLFCGLLPKKATAKPFNYDECEPDYRKWVEDFHTHHVICDDKPTREEMLEVLGDWIKARNSLSSDCKNLGISGSIKDTPKWANELSKRCEPLRRFCEKYKL